MTGFQQYQSFASEEVAQPLLNLLHDHNIPVETGLDRLEFDVNMAYNPTDTRFVVRLRPSDFDAARQLEEQENSQLAAHAAPDHYLFGFSDEELFDILVKPDAWNSYDVALASHVLRQRGLDVTPDTLQLLRQHRVAEMAKPEPTQKTWILAGYLFAALGGVLGILIGWHLQNHQKPLPDGTQVLAFSKQDRTHGFRIMVLGIFGLFVSIVLQIIASNFKL